MNKKQLKTLVLTALFGLLPVFEAMAAVNTKPFTIPELRTWTGAEGQFSLTGQTRVVYRGKQAELTRVANALAADYKLLTGKDLTVAQDKAKDGDIELVLKKDKKLGNEGYSLQIDDKITLSAPTETGLYWGTRTLLQLAESSTSLPKGVATDYPDYGLRGFMLDCGRKYIPITYLRSLVKSMGYYKMNTLQIHLNDNSFKQYFDDDWSKTQAAFRLECDTYPGLTARDGFYTKKEFIELQELAEANGVEIIPEIDFPAHSLAFTQYKPEIGSKDYGMDHLDLFNEETYKFMDALLKEYLGGDQPVFRGKRMHIGTDEYSNRDTAVVEKFRYLTDRYIKYVESFGKQACVWGALTHAKGKTPVKSENVVMSAWYNGYAQPREMLKQGYQLISIPDGLVYIVPAAGYYYDYLNIQHLYKNWTPAVIGKEVFNEKEPGILGGMFAVWNDHAGNGISVKDIHHRVYPALQTLAVKCWDGKNTTVSFEDFNARRLTLSEGPGVNELGRIGRTEKTLVFECASLSPNSRTPHTEIGYNYTVEFDMKAAVEQPGTILFHSPNATFWLADPAGGMFGFSRDGYLYTFRFRAYPGEKVSIKIQGDNKTTRLYANGKLIDDLNRRKISYNKKSEMAQVRTLVFPLAETGAFKSSISNLRVYNYWK